MPQFHLNTDAPISHPFYKLDCFARGYVEAMFFTNCDTGDDDEDRCNELGVEALTEASVSIIAADCAKFWEANKADLEDATTRDGYGIDRAGHDFWYSRQGHGVGYSDRDPLEYDPATREAYEAATAEMIASRDNNSAWGAALAKRQALSPSVGDRLQEAARKFGECYPEIGDDNYIHVR